MTTSVRKQAEKHKIALKKRVEIAKRRKHAVSLLKVGKKSLREILCIKNVDNSTFSRINRFLQGNDEATLERMLSPATCKRGAKTLLTAEEEKMIREKKSRKKAKKVAQKGESHKTVKGEVSMYWLRSRRPESGVLLSLSN